MNSVLVTFLLQLTYFFLLINCFCNFLLFFAFLLLNSFILEVKTKYREILFILTINFRRVNEIKSSSSFIWQLNLLFTVKNEFSSFCFGILCLKIFITLSLKIKWKIYCENKYENNYKNYKKNYMRCDIALNV